MQNEVYKSNPILTDSIVGQISAFSLDSMGNSTPKQNRHYNGNVDNNFKRSSNLLSLGKW